MPTWAIILIIVGVIALIVLIWWIGTSNNIKRMGVKIDEAASGIDVALTKRFDLLTKSFNTVKGIAKHEAETLKSVIAMRNPGAGATMAEKSEFNAKMGEAIKSINVVAEQYPEITASKNFEKLQNQISEVEEQLQASRRVYNSNVSVYNQTIIAFPSSLVAKALHSVKRDFFEAEEAKRKDVDIQF